MRTLTSLAFVSALTIASQTAFGQTPGGAGQIAEINGARISYQIAGEGQPMVLIHGYPLSGNMFTEQASGLSDEFQVITLDLRGYGDSTTPNRRGSIQQYANDVLALMDQLGIGQAIIGGHSMGGVITLEMFRQAPERFLGMVLIDTVAAAASIQEQFLWRGFSRQSEIQGTDSLPPLLLDEQLSGTTRSENPDIVAFTSGMITDASRPAGIAGGNALATRPSYVDMLGQIDVPALVLVGIEDTVTPIPLARQLGGQIPNSQVVIIEEASHLAVLEQPDEANDAIEDWAEDEVPDDSP